MGCQGMPPTMEQLEKLFYLLHKISSEMLTSMSKPHRGGTVLDFWIEDEHRAGMLINLFDLDVAYDHSVPI
jgi:hypothetical protein